MRDRETSLCCTDITRIDEGNKNKINFVSISLLMYQRSFLPLISYYVCVRHVSKSSMRRRMRTEKKVIYIFLYTKALYFEYLMSFSGTRMDDAFAEWTKNPFQNTKKKYKRKEGKKWEGERKETTLYVWAREVPSTWQAKCV